MPTGCGSWAATPLPTTWGWSGTADTCRPARGGRPLTASRREGTRGPGPGAFRSGLRPRAGLRRVPPAVPRSHRRQALCPSLSRVRSSGGHYFNHLSFEKEPAMLWPFRRTTVRPTNPHRFRPGVLALESRWVPSAITEFQLHPLTNGAHIGAAGITAGPDGNVWFTDP